MKNPIEAIIMPNLEISSQEAAKKLLASGERTIELIDKEGFFVSFEEDLGENFVKLNKNTITNGEQEKVYFLHQKKDV
jgi:hypothetical protein